MAIIYNKNLINRDNIVDNYNEFNYDTINKLNDKIHELELKLKESSFWTDDKVNYEIEKAVTYEVEKLTLEYNLKIDKLKKEIKKLKLK